MEKTNLVFQSLVISRGNGRGKKVVFQISSSLVETMLHTKNQLPRLPRAKLRSSSIFKNIEVIFHISSSWVKIMLRTENQLPMLSGSALKVRLGWWGGVVFQLITLSTPTRVEV
jgi:hypothetical protein